LVCSCKIFIFRGLNIASIIIKEQKHKEKLYSSGLFDTETGKRNM